ncbi:DUF6673 family protein [Allofournierella sp.]|uniref:DUF6673 family protein n=1 Tax=Allofournierella sp. TaxID=1940256 RepID=UPI003AB4647B
MLKINGTEVDFDITSPEDLRRYRAAGERMRQAAAGLPDPPAEALTDASFDAYVAFMEAQCRLVTDFIDDAFGQGVCDRLLGPKTSLERLLDLCDAIGEAVGRQSSEVGAKLAQYAPNRATGRAKR